MQQFGGKLHIRSGPSGTAVHATLPVGWRTACAGSKWLRRSVLCARWAAQGGAARV